MVVTSMNKLILKAIGTTVGTCIASNMSKNYLLSKVENQNDNILQENEFPNTTILLPALNEEWMIEKTLQSIHNQNIYKMHQDRFEILLIDSNSEDRTVEISKPYVNKIINVPERNLVKARTIGFKEAMGDLIVLIDADCIYPVNYLNHLLKHYYQDKDVVAVSGQSIIQNLDFIPKLLQPIYLTLNKFNGGKGVVPMIGQNSSCYKWAFNMINGFDVPFEYNVKSSADTQFVLEYYFSKKLEIVGKYIYDPFLVIYDYGANRRHLFDNRKKICNQPNQENKYICNYWKERETNIRF